ncbi:MAG TPA: response regulator [Actinomycetota bacterium]|jgi:DNA-binding NarL/FixJ family response regulator/class 3 adenylate cyclase|nr:response regulator [Actinomycetota bacterium]
MAPEKRAARQMLATVLFTDIVESTRTASKLGDAKWRELLDSHDSAAREEIKRFGGREVKTVGDGFLAMFEGPEDAVRCASAIADAVSELGLEMRAGLHTGQCEFRGSDLGGIAVHIAARIAELADAGEVLVSQTVKELVTGSKLPFVTRGMHSLKGVPGKWRVFRLKTSTKSAPPKAEAPKPATRKTKDISLMIVDDHPLWRASLRQVLEHKKAATVVGEASTGAEALELARKLRPDVIVMDMDLPNMNGVEATTALLADQPDAKILFLSALDTRDKVLEAVEAGASGYLIKTASPDEIANAVRRVNGGEAVFAPSLAQAVLDEFRRLSSGGTRRGKPLDALTAREREVLKLMAEGRSNRAIGERLNLSSKTVEAHVASIFMKLGLQEAPDDHRRVLAVVTYLRSS